MFGRKKRRQEEAAAQATEAAAEQAGGSAPGASTSASLEWTPAPTTTAPSASQPASAYSAQPSGAGAAAVGTSGGAVRTSASAVGTGAGAVGTSASTLGSERNRRPVNRCRRPDGRSPRLVSPGRSRRQMRGSGRPSRRQRLGRADAAGTRLVTALSRGDGVCSRSTDGTAVRDGTQPGSATAPQTGSERDATLAGLGSAFVCSARSPHPVDPRRRSPRRHRRLLRSPAPVHWRGTALPRLPDRRGLATAHSPTIGPALTRAGRRPSPVPRTASR